MFDLLVIEPRYIFGSQAYSAAHLAGSTETKLRRRKLSSTKGNAQGKMKWVSYLPLEFLASVDHVHPESNPHVTVNPKMKYASYHGVIWRVR
jgi:hypothetical protein